MVAVGPEIAAHQALGFLDVRDQPGEHEFERGEFVEVGVDFFLRGGEEKIRIELFSAHASLPAA